MLAIQQMAGNRALSRLIETGATPVQRFGFDDLKDVWHHIKGDDKKEDAKEPTEQSEDVARHAKQVTELGEAVFRDIAERAMRRGDSEALTQATKAAEQFKRGGELIETGERVFTKAGKAAKVIRELDEMLDACQRLRDADLSDLKQQKRGAKALDDLFGSAGEVASDLLPAGPWSGYFTFLQGFKKYDFFGNMTEIFQNEARKAEAASKSD